MHIHEDEDSLKAQGRLLAQLADVGTAPADIVLFTQPTEATPIDAPPGSKPGLLTSHKKYIFIGLGSFCGLLIAVLIAQWVTEISTWRRQKRKLAQDEACRRHVEQYAADIESPTKPPQLTRFKVGESAAPPSANGDEISGGGDCGLPENNTTATNESTTKPSSGMRLPPSVMLHRAPSLRSNLTSIAIRRSSSPREGTPRSPLGSTSGRRLGGLGPASSSSLRRTNSSRNPSSMCSSPRSLESKELTVDASVKARDTRATGWAPHCLRSSSSPATSGPGTPSAPGSPTGAYTLSPGRLIHHMATELDGNSSEEESNSSGTGAGAKYPQEQFGVGGGGDGQTGNNNINKQALVRMGTDMGLADFRLTTSVAEDEVEEERIQTRTSSGSGTAERTTSHSSTLAKDLFSAKSIKPKDVFDATLHDDDTTPEFQPEITTTNSAAAAALVPPTVQTPCTFLSLTGANVTTLSTEDFTSQVTLLHILGAGGAGCVHQGLWNGMPVAVKILHPSRQSSPSAIDAFRREVEVMARVGPHPGIIAVLATCLTPPNLAIVMELAENGSLHSVLHEQGYRPRYGTLLALAEDIACAVAHCHSLKLVHRDLKAHNVLLDSTGNKIKIADFGLSATKNRTFLTVEPGALGTAATMAPEQFAAFEVSERCDSYAFGCLLWEMITGRQPWQECTNIMQIVMAVGCERRRPPIPQECPPQLARLIRECWRHNPALRPGFAEIIDRIRQMKKEDGAAEALLGAASKPRSSAEYTSMAYSSRSSGQFGKPGLSRLAISSS